MVAFITIELADDHPAFTEGLQRLLEIEPDLKVIGQANNASDVVRRVLELKPDILLLDLKMPRTPKALGPLGLVHQLPHKTKKLGAGVSFRGLALHLAGLHIQRGIER